MESLGDTLQAAREAKGISYDQASRETKISSQYLIALEHEDFSCFPGETYITGFLKNYGVYLDLDAQELLSLYRALRIQEQPIPVEQLLKKPTPWSKILMVMLLAIFVLGTAAGGVFLLVTRSESTDSSESSPRHSVEHIMNADLFDDRFFLGDSILISAGEERVRLELLHLGDAVRIGTPVGQVIIDLSQDAIVELDSGSSVRVSAVDYARGNPAMGVRLRFELHNALFSALDDQTDDAVNADIQHVSTVVFSSPNPYPFTLQAHFQAYCMFRWEVLLERDRNERREQFFQRSDELSITAQNGIRVWISNAQSVNFRVIGGGRTVPVEIGSPGEVIVADIRWVRDEDNRFRLIVARLET